MAAQADHGDTSGLPARLRGQVSIEVPTGAGLRDAGAIAKAFRIGMRAKGNRVLPAFFGGRSVWVSWFQNRFHLVRFAEAGQGSFVAHLPSTIAVRGLAWLVDDWLRAQEFENIRWKAAGDPTSASPTPI